MASQSEIKQTATTVLAALLSNPHIYPQTSIEGGDGQMEQKLITLATDIAESLLQHVEEKYPG